MTITFEGWDIRFQAALAKAKLEAIDRWKQQLQEADALADEAEAIKQQIEDFQKQNPRSQISNLSDSDLAEKSTHFQGLVEQYEIAVKKTKTAIGETGKQLSELLTVSETT